MQGRQNFTEVFIRELKPIAQVLSGVEQELRARGDEPELSLSTLPVFNRKIWGLKQGLTIIGGRTSMGKSALAMQIAYDLADKNKEVLFLSLEMSVESMVERLFCNVMEVDNFDMLTGKLKTDLDYQQKWITFSKMMNIPLILSCGIGKTFNEINNILDLLDPKPKVIIVDYIQGTKGQKNEREDMNEYIRMFRELCIKNGIAGILCSQVSRAVFEEGNREPSLFNLKGTGVLEEMADTVLLLHWQHFYDEKANPNIYKVIIAKQRNGRTGEYLLHYKPEFYKFYDVETKKENFEETKWTGEV